jgi:hypothetical protein
MVSSELCCDLLVLYCSLPMRAIDTGAWSFHGIHVFYTQTNPFYTHTNVTLAHLVTLRYVTLQSLTTTECREKWLLLP